MSWSWRDEGCCTCSDHDEEVAREAGTVSACPLFNPSEDMEDCRDCDYWHWYDY